MKAQAAWEAQTGRVSKELIASVGTFEKFLEDTDFLLEPCELVWKLSVKHCLMRREKAAEEKAAASISELPSCSAASDVLTSAGASVVLRIINRWHSGY